MNGPKYRNVAQIPSRIAIFSKVKKTVFGTSIAVSSLLGSGIVSGQESTIKMQERQIRPSHMLYVHPEDSNGKIIVKTGVYATAPDNINVVHAGTKPRNIAFPQSEYEKIIGIREKAGTIYYKFINNESIENLKELHDVYLVWREIDMTNASFNQNGLAEKIRATLVHNGFTRLPPV